MKMKIQERIRVLEEIGGRLDYGCNFGWDECRFSDEDNI